MQSSKALQTFLSISSILNKNGITPTLYGSLGLFIRFGESKVVDDIDFLIPDEHLENTKWNNFILLMNSLGYTQDPNHIHEFIKDETILSFDGIERVSGLVGGKIETEINNKDGVIFALPTTESFLAIYSKLLLSQDRANKKQKQDEKKIEMIQLKIKKNSGDSFISGFF